MKKESNSIILYHGSTDIVRIPVYGHGNPLCDYGLGFYCTEDENAGKLWAVNKDTSGYNNNVPHNTRALKFIILI